MSAGLCFERWKAAGLLSELHATEARRLKLGAGNRSGPPSPEVLHDYYAAGGDAVEALWRRQTDHFIELPARASAEHVCAAVGHAMPELSPLTVRVSARAVLVRAGKDLAAISVVARHARVPIRRLRPAPAGAREIVQACNAILAARGARARFIELQAYAGRHMFVAVDRAQARVLHRWGSTRMEDLGSVWSYAAWDRESRARAS